MIRCFALASVPGAIPCRWQVAGKRHQRGAIDLGTKRRGDIMPGDAVLEMGDPLPPSSSSRATSGVVGSTTS